MHMLCVKEILNFTLCVAAYVLFGAMITLFTAFPLRDSQFILSRTLHAISVEKALTKK
jgi:hypothetical protein